METDVRIQKTLSKLDPNLNKMVASHMAPFLLQA
jgi:hypothetical protein